MLTDGGFVMARSRVASGLHVQRDRASTRGRHDEPARRASDPNVELCYWIDGNVRLRTVADVKAIHCRRFLQQTGTLDVPASARLAHLAEHAVEWMRIAEPAGWAAVRVIYEHALRLGEAEPWRVWRSLAS